jgi:hypothetical protein
MSNLMSATRTTAKFSPRTFEIVAATISAGIVLFMICYWIVQIVGVAHMLRLAYG